ncbi:MAG TPA: hypothetical protein VHE60_10985 [Pyrinomonadaceae bacterium]|nr:hypothetical protein [Pyrinomonadaceae bacterium]
MGKQAELMALAKLRQATRYPGYKCIGDYHGGVYECDFVSPYTKSAGKLDAEIMFMLQDWSSDKSLNSLDEDSATLGYSRHVLTNRNLIRLLNATFGLTLRDAYGTNLFPFIKPGGMSADIPEADLIKAAREFALPQIRIVNPKLVICLGMQTFNAVREVSGLTSCPSQDSAIKDPFDLPGAETRIWCQAHTGYWGQLNRNKGDAGRVSRDWRKMKRDVIRRVGPQLAGKARRLATVPPPSAQPKAVSMARNEIRPLTMKENKMKYFILNNKRERPHRSIYALDDELRGFPIYDYDDKQALHAFNLEFQEMKPGSLALVFGQDLMVKDIFRVTGTKRKHASDLGKDVFVVYGEYLDSLGQPVRYRNFIAMNKLSNPNLDPNNNFRRGMLVAHVY